MNPMWKVYKSKVMKTLNPEMEEDTVEDTVTDAAEDITPIQSDEGPNAMTQLAKRMQGAGAKGWRSVSSLFTKDDEHQLLEADNHTEHVSLKPEEPPRPNKCSTGFWDNFATKWHQAVGKSEDTPAFKWNFVTSKLAELKTKSMAKSN
uniref:Testis development-related protein-like n=1 Tax=Sinocyclocheilus grahami TaxID=75366 RepID=A0A672KSP8_SINGR